MMLLSIKKLIFYIRFKLLLNCSRRLFNAIFSCLLHPHYQTYPYQFERQIHYLKKAWWHKRRKLSARAGVAPLLIDQLDQLFAKMIDCGFFRYQVGVYADLKLCEREIKEIAKVIDAFFLVIYQGELNSDNFLIVEEKIANLENIYEQVLTVAIKDPFYYLLFIISLRVFNKNLYELQRVTASCK